MQRLILTVVLLLALAACRRELTEEDIVRQRKPQPTSGKTLGPPPPIVEPVTAPSQGDCAPKDANNLTTFGACCNDKPCRGQCVKGEDGRIECACYEVKGGCPPDKVCSKLRRACVPPKEAEWP